MAGERARPGDLSFANILSTKRSRSTVLGESALPKSRRGARDRHVRAGRRGSQSSPGDHFAAWKKNVGILYDAMVYHSLTWSSLTCAMVPQDALAATDFGRQRQIVYSSRTNTRYDPASRRWGAGHPSQLIVATLDAPEPNTTNRKYIGRFAESNKSSRVAPVKRIIHPGEINRVRVSPLRPSLAVTHTDSPHVFVWDLESQPTRNTKSATAPQPAAHASPPASAHDGDDGGAPGVGAEAAAAAAADAPMDAPPADASPNDGTRASLPDLVLTGHKDKAEFALDLSASSHHVLSGGSDSLLCLWNLADVQTGSASAAVGGAELASQATFQGHSDAVETCVFDPQSEGRIFASAGRDRSLLFWDSRAGSKPTGTVPNLHENDINCCAWNELGPDLLATGCDDGYLSILDRRKLSTASLATAAISAELPPPAVVHRFRAHSGSIQNVRWSPHSASLLASGGADACLNVWSCRQLGSDLAAPELYFRHAGHKGAIADFAWDQYDPWAFMSVSDDLSPHAMGGKSPAGTLQFWRITEVLTSAEDPTFRERIASAISSDAEIRA